MTGRNDLLRIERKIEKRLDQIEILFSSVFDMITVTCKPPGESYQKLIE